VKLKTEDIMVRALNDDGYTVYTEGF